MSPLSDIAEWLLGVAAAALDKGPTGAPHLTYVSFSPAAWDNCCEGRAGKPGGQLTAWFGNVVPTVNFPQPILTPRPCDTPYAVPVTIELVRCAPSIDDSGNLTLDKLTGPLHELMDDGWRILRAIQCAYDEGPWGGIVTGMTPLPEQGGCHGLTVSTTTHLIRWRSDA